MLTRSLQRSVGHALLAAGAGLLAISTVAPIASAHQLTVRYESPLPLVAYLLGAAIAVAASFALVLFRGESAGGARTEPSASIEVPALVRSVLRAVGLVAWLWIAVQAIVGVIGESDASSLFGWIYGWVGLALVSAFVGPAWRWIDPFSSLFDLLAAAVSRLGVGAMTPLTYPAWLGHWPAVGGYAFFVWLELAVPQGRGGQFLGLAMLAYTALTLLLMSQFGRDTWRERGETFSVWFGQLGRLAPLGLDSADPDRRVVRRPFASALVGADWPIDRLVLVAIATAAVIFDGMSQTEVWFGWFGAPGALVQTLLLFGWIGLIVAIALLTSRVVGVAPLASGLVPIAAGYIVAHYLTYLLFDGQRVALLVTDPLSRGSDLIHLGEFEPITAWLPAGIVWAIQLVAIVGGHVTGALAGHRVAVAEARRAVARGGPAEAADRPAATVAIRSIRARQVPLAILMVGLTTLTLWSLGQNIVAPAGKPAALVATQPND